MIITETFENNIFAEGNTFNFEVSVNEIGKSIAINTKVIFSYVVHTTSANNVPDTLIIDYVGSLPIGAYSNNVWTLGNILDIGYKATFSIQLLANDINYIEVTYLITTDSVEQDKTNNSKKYIWTGTPFNSLDIYERYYEIPSSAFASIYLPTDTEVLTWVNNNLYGHERQNGTLIGYNPDPYSEIITYNNLFFPIYNLQTTNPGSIINIIINGVTYTGSFPYDILDENIFNETTFKSFVEASMISSGVTGTVAVDDSFQGATLSINAQIGINSFVITRSDASTQETVGGIVSYIVYTGTKEPRNLWQLNYNTDTNPTINSIRRSDKGDVWYLSPIGRTGDYAVKGNSDLTANNLYHLIKFRTEESGDLKAHFYPGDYIFDDDPGDTYIGDKINNLSFEFQNDSTLDVRVQLFDGDDIVTPIDGKRISIKGYPDIILRNDFIWKTLDNDTVYMLLNNITQINGNRLLFAGAGKDVYIEVLGTVVYQHGLLNIGTFKSFLPKSNVNILFKGKVINNTSSDGRLIYIENPYSTQETEDWNVNVEINSFADYSNLTNPIIYLQDIPGVTYFGVTDSILRLKINNVYTTSTPIVQTPYGYVSGDTALFMFRKKLTNTKIIIEGGGDWVSNTSLFKVNPVQTGGQFCPDLDSSEIIFKNITGTFGSHFVSFILRTTSRIINNSKIIFENCNFISKNSFIADFDLKPGTADDGTAKVIFKNCRLETQEAGEPLIYFRGTNLILTNCVLINDGITECISADAPINVTCYNVAANTLALNVNVTEIGQQIYRDLDLE